MRRNDICTLGIIVFVGFFFFRFNISYWSSVSCTQMKLRTFFPLLLYHLMCIDLDAIHLRITVDYTLTVSPTNNSLLLSWSSTAHFQLLLRALELVQTVRSWVFFSRAKILKKHRARLHGKRSERHAQNKTEQNKIQSHCQRKSQSGLVHVSFLLESFRKACLTLFLKRFETMHGVGMYRYAMHISAKQRRSDR